MIAKKKKRVKSENCEHKILEKKMSYYIEFKSI